MKIIKKSLVVLLLIGSISIISCGDDSSSDDDPDPYIKFSGGSYGSNEWTQGLSNYGDGEPVCATENIQGFYCIALRLKTDTTTYKSNKDLHDHIFIHIAGGSAHTYPQSDCDIKIRFDGKQNTEVSLTSRKVVVTKVNNNYIEGTFEGTTPSPESTPLTGSFVFKRKATDSWPSGL